MCVLCMLCADLRAGAKSVAAAQQAFEKMLPILAQYKLRPSTIPACLAAAAAAAAGDGVQEQGKGQQAGHAGGKRTGKRQTGSASNNSAGVDNGKRRKLRGAIKHLMMSTKSCA